MHHKYHCASPFCTLITWWLRVNVPIGLWLLRTMWRRYVVLFIWHNYSHVGIVSICMSNRIGSAHLCDCILVCITETVKEIHVFDREKALNIRSQFATYVILDGY